MIENIRLLEGIGTFDSDSAASSLSLKRLTLIYGENGCGKTTLAAVLRSLATKDSQLINERHRLGSNSPPKVVLTCSDSGSCYVFERGVWNGKLPELNIFDDVFVDENVYSGLNVDAQHGQSLHNFILGEQGVDLSRKREKLGTQVEQHNAKIRVKGDAIRQRMNNGISVDEFCALPFVPEIDDKINAAERKLMAASNRTEMRSAPKFPTLGIPGFDKDNIEQILLTGLSDIDSAAVTQVWEHAKAFGEGGESWVETGFRHMVGGDDETCPFCGQSTDGLDLVAHYRAYFSEGYKQLKQKLAEMAAEIESSHSGSVRVEFMGGVAQANKTRHIWKDYIEVPNIDIASESIAKNWESAIETVTRLVQAKLAAPLEPIVLDDDSLKVLNSFERHRLAIREINEVLSATNKEIDDHKRSSLSTDIRELHCELDTLKATRERFTDEIATLCEEYIEEQKSKKRTVAAKEKATKRLEEFRTVEFPKIEVGVNDVLQRFRAGFLIRDLKPTNLGSGTGSSSAYDVVVNDSSIPAKSTKKSKGKPSFRNLLSAGDRNTLALALFFSSLYKDPNLANSIVIIDDPLSSLDDHRSFASAVAVRELSTLARQVIVLSHNKDFLCTVWNNGKSRECCSLEIARTGGKSTIRNWQVSDEKYSEHDYRHRLLKEYAESKSGRGREVAASLRDHLEFYFRATCADEFKPGHPLGDFLNHCREKVGKPKEVLTGRQIQELDEIVEYSSRFHHSKNPPWETKQINSEELLNYVEMTLRIVRP